MTEICHNFKVKLFWVLNCHLYIDRNMSLTCPSSMSLIRPMQTPQWLPHSIKKEVFAVFSFNSLFKLVFLWRTSKDMHVYCVYLMMFYQAFLTNKDIWIWSVKFVVPCTVPVWSNFKFFIIVEKIQLKFDEVNQDTALAVLLFPLLLGNSCTSRN